MHQITRCMLYLELYMIFTAYCCGQFADGDARLFGGKENEGIVQLYQNTSWKTICSLHFHGKEAGVVCRQLGYNGGNRLPAAAYSEYADIEQYNGVLQGCPTGQEARLTDCTFDANAACKPTSFAYASVKCYDVLQDPLETLKLDNGNGSDASYFSSLSIYRFGTWGQICGEFWDDKDATVACQQLGYKGGRASYSDRGEGVPLVVGNIECSGNETRLEDCTETEQFCYNNRVGGVFCYKNEAPQFSLAGGTERYGKVILSVDGIDGLLCGKGLTYLTADIICKDMGYHSGYDFDKSFEAPSVTMVLLQDIDCTGEERSFWECPNSGWGNIAGTCQDPQNGFSVYCYTEVRLFSSVEETADLLVGCVELWDERWQAICAEIFTQDLANLVCSEFGFAAAEILVPDAFGRRQSSTSVNSVQCSGTETSLSLCNHTLGACPQHQEQANILCRHENALPDEKVTLSSGSYYDRVYVERYGIEGTICRRGWDDNDAAVVCRSLGFNYGVALGTSSLFARYKPVWKADVGCYGNETDLSQCSFTTVNGKDWGCSEDLVAAGVLCSNNRTEDPPVRLKDGISDTHGRVEVYHEQTGWGTICNTDWSVSDADVVCRQLGFAEGQIHANAYTQGTALGPVVLNGMNCDGSETSILQCPSKGWRRISTSCDHSNDAGVFCYKYVILTPATFYGAVLIHKGDYKLVCADSFDKYAADVTCRELGFFHSKILCCSAMGPQNYVIGVSDVRCTGSEASLRFCEHEEVNPSCPSGNYAAVVCSTYDGPFQKLEVLTDGRIRLTYFINQGFICAEDFSEKDAAVVCHMQGFSYSYGIKVSAQGIEHSIRWLRDMQCKGNESSIMDCGHIQWGQIGGCDWNMVAGVICTQDQAGLEFDVRLVNGTETSGRVEVKINNEWGTICGTDFTKNEALVICSQLGFFDGVALAAGHHGAGIGEVILNGVTCSGREKTLKDCVWSGYKQTSELCDHSKDAAVRCYNNLRLTGSTTVNYGRLEVYHNEDADWLAVCDYGLNINEANVLCRMLGYNTGLFQRGSPLGLTNQPIRISDIDCISQTACTFSKGECRSGKYVALYCSDGVITTEGVRVRLPLSSHYGPVEIQRFGLWGAICDLDFDNSDAEVVCRQLNFKSGYALSTFRTEGFPTIQCQMNCVGNETRVADCDRGNFADDHGCYNRNTVAGVFCSDDGGVQFTTTDIDAKSGLMDTRAEIVAMGKTLYIDLDDFTEADSTVYCRTLGFAGGTVSLSVSGVYGVMDVSCHGNETSIFQCPAQWDPRKVGQEGSLAGVTCFKAVSLLGGVFDQHGVVYSVRDSNFGPVCAEGFDETDAGVACRGLGFDKGLVLCCSVYGTVDDTPVMTDVQCSGNEEIFTDCPSSDVLASEVTACKVNYAAVACYRGDKTSDYSVSLPTSDTYNGVVILTHLDIEGRICADGWDNDDADVVCKELGFFRGFAQITQREDVCLPVSNGPYWTSNINCSGTENRLTDCDITEFGTVTKCESRHYAGVICYDREGLFYRLAGSDEPRYGRVEVSIQGGFHSICNLYWGNTEAHVLCGMLGFRTGEAYHGSYTSTAQGTVWDANFQCTGSESKLNDCPFTSWEVAVSPECAAHQNDAGAFCYTSVKLSTGVGRATDRGGVLLYWNDRWNTICSDDFNDMSARVVCRELGFQDGQAQCCSAYGELLQYGHVVTHKVKCGGNEDDVTSCLVEEVCQTQQYASVVCYGFLLTTEAMTTSLPQDQKFDPVPIIIAVVLFVVLVIIALIVTYCVIKRRKRLKLEKTKEQFDNRIVSQTRDSSLIVRNPMHEMGTPEISRVRYTPATEEAEAVIPPAYLNHNYANELSDTSGSQEPVNINGIQPVVERQQVPRGANRTVININPHAYEKLASNRGHENPYDNATHSDVSATVRSNNYETIGDVRETEGNEHSTMVEQPHVSSPHDTMQEPKWPNS